MTMFSGLNWGKGWLGLMGDVVSSEAWGIYRGFGDVGAVGSAGDDNASRVQRRQDLRGMNVSVSLASSGKLEKALPSLMFHLMILV